MIDLKAVRERAARRASVASPARLLTEQPQISAASVASPAKLLIKPPAISNLATLAGHATQKTARLRRFRLTAAEADRCHSPAWSEPEIAAFTARVVMFIRRGIGATDADDLAERLTLRDRDLDDRRTCAECRHGAATRCPDGSPIWIDTLHRCGSFSDKTLP